MTLKRTDYLLHFLCGLFVCYVFFSFGWWWSLGIVAIVGGGKELYDLLSKKGDADWKDFACTIASFPVVLLIEEIKTYLPCVQ